MKNIKSSNQSDERILQLSKRCVTHVQNSIGVELDYTIDTLGILDHFIKGILKKETGEKDLPPGHKNRSSIVHLMAPTVGAYLGEVIIRKYPAYWRIKDNNNPLEWVVEFSSILLRIRPVATVAEAFMEENLASSHVFQTAPADAEMLAKRLEIAPPLPENEFHLLVSKFEVIQIMVESLMGKYLSKDSLKNVFAPSDYDLIFPTQE